MPVWILLAPQRHATGALAERKLPEIDATIEQLRLLRGVVADCLHELHHLRTSGPRPRVQPEEPEN